NQVPQLVSITFDDNFGIEDATGEGGIPWIMSAWKAHQNPSGGTLATFAGNSNNFNDADRLASFYVTTNYMAPDFDTLSKNRKSWADALAAGHEIADHTIRHINGGDISSGVDDPAIGGCEICVAHHFKETDTVKVPIDPAAPIDASWTTEIKGAKDMLLAA